MTVRGRVPKRPDNKKVCSKGVSGRRSYTYKGPVEGVYLACLKRTGWLVLSFKG